MSALELTSKEEFERITLKGISIVDFSAQWCSPCRAQAPIIDALNDAYKGSVTMAKLNIDENPLIAMELGIQSIPTIIIFKEGREIERFIGFQGGGVLENALKKVLA